jgi:hypothetical protein
MQEHVVEMVRSAKEEILVIFSTPDEFRRQVNIGGLDLLVRTIKSKGVKVRYLLPVDDYVRNLIDKTNKETKIKIEIRNIEEPFPNRLSVLRVDKASMLSVEVKMILRRPSMKLSAWLSIPTVNRQSYHMFQFLKIFGVDTTG